MIQAVTALGYATLYPNQAIFISTRYRPIQGLLLSPGPKKSLARFIENEKITEKRIDNQKIFPVPTNHPVNKNHPPTGNPNPMPPCPSTASS